MFNEINPAKMDGNVFDLIGKKWMLITAGDKQCFNTMTASWGGMGVLWNKNVVFSFVRPQRYTFEFMEKSDTFTLSFFNERFREALNLCGSKSGRDVDKVKATGLTPAFSNSSVYFEEADMVLLCKKIYFQDFRPEYFLDASIEKNYSNKDYHRMYVGDIQKILLSDK